MLISGSVNAQSTNIPQDTSYTIYSNWQKLKKHYPFVSPISPDLPKKIEARWDVVYTDIDGRLLHMDIFYPKLKKQKKYPGVLLIHGGGWASGSKAHQVPMAQQLAARGYVTAAVEYRLSPEAKFPAAVLDLKTSVRFLRAFATDYGLDTARIAALGASAGAHLASMLGTTGDVKDFDGPAYPRYSSAGQAVVNIDGIVSFIHPEAASEGSSAGRWLGSREEAWDNWKAASPLEYADDRTPPFLFINSSIPRFHAGRDDLIKLLNGFGTYTEVHTIPDSPHSFWLVHPWFEQTLAFTAAFLEKELKN
ncbi:MAG TPA: alpha/beta hydrolase [Flavilitoribacter sp.]|nr:alpha/beta hydrolase [Flavilitoribacter sp.]